MVVDRKPKAKQRDTALETHIARLRDAAAAHQALEPPMLEATRALGFDSFMYAMSAFDPRPHHDTRAHVWTTLPGEWLALYEQRRYIDVDPRLTHTWNRTAPYVWDAATTTGEWQVQQFMRDAARFGICSGVALSFRDARQARIVVALNSRLSPVSLRRHAIIRRRLGDVMLLATSLHDIFTTHFGEQRVRVRESRASLSIRERQCLQLAARGMTSADIGTKLGITARTANFHFSNLIDKLGVINRHEAIARAVSTGMISAGSDD